MSSLENGNRKRESLAKEKGKYKGRKRKEIDDKFLEKIISRFQKKEIPLEEARLATGLSKSTFYRRIKENQ